MFYVIKHAFDDQAAVFSLIPEFGNDMKTRTSDIGSDDFKSYFTPGDRINKVIIDLNDDGDFLIRETGDKLFVNGRSICGKYFYQHVEGFQGDGYYSIVEVVKDDDV